ncbi:MAG TPA: hypothetical protein VMH31_10000 [Methylomirabilota bacterium]|nr:hypothetical protein [Methylomirabilota bacterium]HVM74264.1 hypothetical protein [Candidatus Saccharimonadales bacterium]
MPAQANANVLALQLEKVRDKVPLLYERDDILLTMIQQRGDIERVSSRNMRLPLQLVPGGKAGSYNADGGDLGRGSGSQYDVAQVSPIFFRFAVEMTKLAQYATTGRERAVEDNAKREVVNGMRQFRSFLDKLMQTAGNGVLGTVGSFATTTWTMSTPPGAALVYPGQTIQVYDPTLTTNRGTANVVSADPISGTQTIVVDANPGGLTAGDVIVHDGLSGTSPVSLFGIKYHQNNATTGTWLNLNRATYPIQLATPRVNAGNAALTPAAVRLAINKVRKALGINHLSKLIAYMAVEQEHAWENLGITVSQVIKEGGSQGGNDLDLLFTGRKTMSGVPIKSSVNADQTRVDFLDLSHWGRAVLKDIDFYEVNGNTVFPIYGASGGLAASFIFYFDTAFQIWNDSPRSGAYIDTLARPSGY